MTMPVTDKQLAALRARLAGRLEEHKKLFAQLDWPVDGEGYTALHDAAFFEAVDRRFGPQTSAEDVITYVADVRARTEHAGEDIDPDVAERLINKVLGRGSTGNVDPRAAFTARQYLLVALVVDAGYDDAGLDEFLGESRKIADQWLT
jgi:hypothetical protein